MLAYNISSSTLDTVTGKIYKIEYIKSIYRTKIQKFKRNDYVMVPNSYYDFFKYFKSFDQLKERFFSVYKNIDIYTIIKSDTVGNIIEFTVSDILEDNDFSIIRSNPIIISGVILTGIETSDPEESSIKSIIGVSQKVADSIEYLYPFQLSMPLSGYNLLYNLSSSKDEVKL